MAEITLGTNNAFAAKRWPESRAWAKIVAEELGLKDVQYSMDLLDPLLPEPGRGALCEDIVRTAKEYGLSVRTTFSGLIGYAQNLLTHPDRWRRDQAFRWYEGAIDITRKLGALGTGGHMGAMSAEDYRDEARRRFLTSSLIDAVKELSRYAASSGLEFLLWEPMPTPREAPHTPEEAVELMQAVNEGGGVPVKLCFDLGHCCAHNLAEPGDPHEWLEKLLPWTPVVHLQQTDGKGDHHWPFTKEFNRVGIVQPERIVEIVKSSPLERVDLVFEIAHAFEAPDRQVIDDHKQSVEIWANRL